MRRLLSALCLSLLIAGPALAEPTTITVRGQSRDAKFIGTSMGGVAVKLTDAKTGKLLAEGLTAGGTGDTAKLVTSPKIRGETRAGAEDAGFTATVEVAAPTLVKLEATGPQGHKGAAITVTSMAWVLPGQPVVGDGWVVEFPGLVVEPTLARAAGKLTVTAKVTLMCGCPITPGGHWDADHLTLKATIAQTGGPPRTLTLSYAGEASTFRGEIEGITPQAATVTVSAFDGLSGNAGVGEASLVGQ